MKRCLLGLALLAACLTKAWSDDLGRIFFTPEQRALLELARRTQTAGGPSEAGGGLTLNGILTRSDGRQTVWINGRPHPDARARAPGTALIPLETGQQVRLRVGQTLDPVTGRVVEPYRLPRPPAAPDKPAAGPAGAAPAPQAGADAVKPARPRAAPADAADEANEAPSQ